MTASSFDRVVTHAMAREAYSRLHNAYFNDKRGPVLTIPPNQNDVDMLITDYIAQQEAKELAGAAPAGEGTSAVQLFVVMASGFMQAIFPTYLTAQNFADRYFTTSPEVEILERNVILLAQPSVAGAERPPKGGTE